MQASMYRATDTPQQVNQRIAIGREIAARPCSQFATVPRFTPIFAANFCFLLLMYRLTWYTALFHAAAATFLMGISEFIPYSILFSFFHSSGKPNDYFFSLVLLTAISKTLYFTFMTLLAHYEKRILDIPPDKTFFFLISIPIISLFLMLSLFFISENGNLPTFINCMISASAVLLLICNLLVYAADSYSKKRNQSFTELSLQLQKEQDATEYYKLLLRQNENQNILTFRCHI